ncbi:hypothetical protein SAMN04515667_1484 [Formosa sp. Hel1_31_208]|uniref:hypothetical protein n=1 Tax=Formosa sp. Hel1_31_208 TaxID=1798225 RepID=UPI00087C7008|nr:hypothetical protein [Formosa sp. Hel1_31_208]SDS13253.1 hypothetical protein SAMN04515667_1484 [Formosa sp. Hel1_31_208]
MISIIIHQLKSLRLTFLVIFFTSFTVIGGVFLIHVLEDVPLEFLTNDLAVIGKVPPYTGIQSQLGIFLWAATAAICFFGSALSKNAQNGSFLKVSAGISLFLGLDDVFMFHEIVFPVLGVHQKIVFLGYGLLISVYLLKFYKVILTTDFLLLGCALACFAISLLVDNFFYEASYYVTKLLEDGAKFVGILIWLIYFVRTNKQMVERA